MKTLFEGKHLRVVDHDGWQYVERMDADSAVAVIAETDRGELILTEQFRKSLHARVIDFPAGLVGDDGVADPEATARKELEEETGYTCKSVELLARGCTSPGITTEIVSLYRAHGVRKVGQGGGVGGESITVHLVPRAEIIEWLRGRDAVIDIKLAAYFLSA
jgi:ADP-ribose pyrophosphatase